MCWADDPRPPPCGQSVGRTAGPSRRIASLVDEAHARAGVDVAILHLLPAGTAPREVHLADEEPVAAGVHRDDAAIVAAAAGTLDAGREDDGRAGPRRGTARVVAPEQVGAARVHDLGPPVAPTESRPVDVIGRVDAIDAAVAARRHGPLGRGAVEVLGRAARLSGARTALNSAGRATGVAARR